MGNLHRIGALVSALTLAACSEKAAPPPAEAPDTRAADEAAIRANVAAWSGAAGAKDAEKFASFYTEDGVILLEDGPDISGIAAIRDGIGGMMKDPAFALSFEVANVVVARSGDLAYETGSYALTLSAEGGKPATEKGHYVVVWRKQADGAWKVAVDAPVSDPPEQAAPTKP